jgi:hypothetical protein
MSNKDELPKKSRNRARRRHLMMRARAKARRVAEWIGWDVDWTVKNADHLKNCSCLVCGNPRKHWNEKTIQEKRMDEKILLDKRTEEWYIK